MGASDYFEAVRAAAAEVSRIERAIARMRSAIGPGGSGVSVSGGSRGGGDAAAPIDRVIDYELRVQPTLDEDRALLGRAAAVLYGRDGSGGVARAIGSAYADAVWWRACCALSWGEVSRRCVASRSTVKRWYAVAMDYVDAVGFEGAAEGAEV